MTDIVERLRADAKWLRGEPDCVGPSVTLLTEQAADEIVKLRGQLKALVLNNAILRQRPDLPLNRIPAARAMTKLYEENERLRAALELFACDCAVNERCAVPDNCRNFQARRTLEKQP